MRDRAGRSPTRRAIAAALLTLGALLISPAAAFAGPGLDVRSGSLVADVTADPFAITLTDEADGDVLRTRAGGIPSPDDSRARYGPLGYSYDLRHPAVNNAYLGYYAAAEAETLWFHGRHVLSSSREGEALVLDVETNDPLGHRLQVRLEPAGEGGIAVSSRVAPGSGPLAGQERISGASFEAAEGERFLGFGERSNAVDQTGGEVFNWAEEGPFSSGEGEALFRPLIPDFTFPTGPTATNLPIPWTVTTRGFGLLIDQTQRSRFRLGSDIAGAWQAETETNNFRFVVFAGPEPADALRRYSQHAGRQPRPAPWIFGPWVQMPSDVARRFREESVPATVSQTYTHYLPCGAHVGREQAEADLVRFHHSLGYKVTTYFNPHVCTDYQPPYGEAAANGWFVRNSTGEPYLLSNPFTADERVSEIDFTNDGARGYFQRLLDEAIDVGYDGWMEDFGEYTPTDSRFSDGRDGLEMHNRYPVLYHCASYEHTRERMGRDAAVFIRSGFNGVQPCARVVWGGDPTEDWSCADGLCGAVHQALSIGLSGIAYWGTDIGGFHAVVNSRTSDELNARWLEFGAVNGVMRTQRNGFAVQGGNAGRSQVWDPEVLPIWRRYAKLRTQLYPYIAAASREYRQTGMPLTRHLALAYPGDPAAVRRQEDFLFGPDLLVAPVVQEGATERELYLPEGRWIDFWRSIDYRPGSGAFRVGAAQELTGGRQVTLPAPLEEMPMLLRAGTMLPLLPPEVDTLAELRGGSGTVRLRDRGRERRLLAFPRGNSRARLDRGVVVAKEGGGGPPSLDLRFRSGARIDWTVQVSLATLRDPFEPCEVSLDGRPLPERAWSYDPRARRLRARFDVGAGTLSLTGAPGAC